MINEKLTGLAESKMGTRLKYKAKWVDYEGFCKVKLGSKAKKSNKLSKFKFKFKN